MRQVKLVHSVCPPFYSGVIFERAQDTTDRDAGSMWQDVACRGENIETYYQNTLFDTVHRWTAYGPPMDRVDRLSWEVGGDPTFKRDEMSHIGDTHSV